jgi:ABC-type molybdate transport system substrate-binding protein
MTPWALPPTIAAIGIAVAVTACSTPPFHPDVGRSGGRRERRYHRLRRLLVGVRVHHARPAIREGASGHDVRFSFAGSTALVAQLTAGAPADVFAAADEATMGAVVEAGLVYVTDAEDAGDKVTAVAIPESGQAENSYPIALLGESRNLTGAKLFVEMVTGPIGRKALAGAGFTVP